MFEIEFTPEARDDLKGLKKSQQIQILDAIDQQLRYEPTVETRNRKRLRPNLIAEWELRIGRFRVFFNVEQPVSIVSIEAIGFKIGNLFYVRGEKREL
ncbi:MAG: type II toxin-antitoxin system RelE/ParE family toxin [Chloroflexi bacterium]|nr:type II toxin-antitoxin system RelE/ParE family toxin [Chloroflexota bacterium]